MEDFAASSSLPKKRPTQRPLLGLTVLLVEDSRYFSDAVRLMSIRSGARLRRADCLMSARKHIKIYRPDVVLVDLGLPDGAGQDFIQEIAMTPGSPPIIAMSGEMDETNQENALGAGAVMFLQKPFFDLASFQQTLLSALPNTNGDFSFRPLTVGDSVLPDGDSLREDFSLVMDIIQDALSAKDTDKIHYCAQFLSSIGNVAGDDDLIAESATLNAHLATGGGWENSCQRVLKMLNTRLAA